MSVKPPAQHLPHSRKLNKHQALLILLVWEHLILPLEHQCSVSLRWKRPGDDWIVSRIPQGRQQRLREEPKNHTASLQHIRGRIPTSTASLPRCAVPFCKPRAFLKCPTHCPLRPPAVLPAFSSPLVAACQGQRMCSDSPGEPGPSPCCVKKTVLSQLGRHVRASRHVHCSRCGFALLENLSRKLPAPAPGHSWRRCRHGC